MALREKPGAVAGQTPGIVRPVSSACSFAAARSMSPGYDLGDQPGLIMALAPLVVLLFSLYRARKPSIEARSSACCSRWRAPR
jgi:hypothetical protein